MQEPAQSNAQQFVQQPPVISKPGYLAKLFTGRMNRQNYIIGSTIVALVPLLFFFGIVFNTLLNPNTFALPYLDPTDPTKIDNYTSPTLASLLTTPVNETLLLAGTLFVLLSIPYLLSFQFRRLHDLNRSGWWLLISLVPFINYVFSFYISLWPGTKGTNKYGNEPLPRINVKEDMLLL